MYTKQWMCYAAPIHEAAMLGITSTTQGVMVPRIPQVAQPDSYTRCRIDDLPN